MHKLRLAAVAAAALFLLSGCQFTPTPPKPIVDADKYITAYENNWQYKHLSSADQARYGAIYTVLTDSFAVDEIVTVAGKEEYGVRIPLPYALSSKEEAKALYNAFFRDNPRFFYVDNAYELEGYMQDDVPQYDTLALVYTLDAAARRTACAALEQRLNEALQHCPVSQDQYEMELYLHDWLVQNCTYSDKAASVGSAAFPNAFNAYGALVEGEAVCEGYARGLQLLLAERGIASTPVIGRSLVNDEDHMWNLVKVNGFNYFVDATWNDSNGQTGHTYFNLSSALMARTHTIADGQTGIAVTTAFKDNFFVRNKRYINTYDRDTIAACIAEAYLAGDTVIEIRFDADKYDNGVLFLKNRKLTAGMVGQYLPSGASPLWDYELLGDTHQYVLTLIKK
ncbi:MAG: hypothetical protein IJO76_06050 [Clostridia bacterium]|nr:hypothetical protein [Clostridia bacterium]